MQKRRILLGTYDTAGHGWTLTGWKLGAAEQKTKYLEKANGDGSWDLSTALSDGIMKYKDRALTATFECSEGTRMEREEIIREMINTLDGEKLEIRLPDDDQHHLVGRIHVRREYNDLAHAAVSVQATCEPWKYNDAETFATIASTTEPTQATLHNRGKRAIVPTITVTGGPVVLEFQGASIELSAGTYSTPSWPDLLLKPGSHAVTCSGAGTVAFRYREAVLE